MKILHKIEWKIKFQLHEFVEFYFFKIILRLGYNGHS